MPLTQRQIYRRRRIVVFGGGGLALATAFYLPMTLLAPLPEVAPTLVAYSGPVAEQPLVDFPPYGASGFSAIGYDGVLAQGGVADPLPIASISKIVSALVVLEAHPLVLGESGPDVTMSALDEQFYAEQVAQDGIVAPVSTGLMVSQRNLLNLSLMASANNYAQSLAAWAFGSEAAYVEAARVWLDAHGLTGTVIADATGIMPGNVSTVPDLIEIARLAVEHPVIAEVVATAAVEVPNIGTVLNRNQLLGVDGVDGIKTGTLDEAGSCLLFSADRVIGSETVTIIGVVLGGPSHETINAAIRGILAQADAGFREVTLATAGDVFGAFETTWGDTASAVAESTTTALLWAGTAIDADVTVEPVRLADAGTDVGDAHFSVGQSIVTVELVLDSTIDDPGPWWRLANPTKLM